MQAVNAKYKNEEKKIPNLRFPGFKGEWEFKRIGDFIEERKKFAGPELPLYSLTIEKGIVPKTERYERSFLVQSKEDAYKIMKPNDFAFNPMNLRFGALAMHKGNFDVAVSKYYNIFYCNEGTPGYLELYLTSYNMIQFYNRMAIGTLEEKKRVHYLDFIHFKKLFPSLPEQQKIAYFLSAVDQKIQQLTRKKELLEQYKKGVMQKIFSQEINFKQDDGSYFPNWEVIRAKDVFKNHSNKNHNGDLPILAASQKRGMVYRDSIDIQIKSSEASVKSYKVVEKGDFVISLRSFQGGIEYSYLNGICSPAYTILKPVIPIIDAFFKFYFKKEDFIERLSKTIIGIRDGKQITYENFGWLKLNIPSNAEQQKIAEFLSNIDNKIESIQTQITQTQKFKNGLLQQMFV